MTKEILAKVEKLKIAEKLIEMEKIVKIIVEKKLVIRRCGCLKKI